MFSLFQYFFNSFFIIGIKTKDDCTNSITRKLFLFFHFVCSDRVWLWYVLYLTGFKGFQRDVL